MKVYLAEIIMNGKMEPIGVYSAAGKAKSQIGPKEGILSELELDKTYLKGIGIAKHWHLNVKEDSNGQ